MTAGALVELVELVEPVTSVGPVALAAAGAPSRGAALSLVRTVPGGHAVATAAAVATSVTLRAGRVRATTRLAPPLALVPPAAPPEHACDPASGSTTASTPAGGPAAAAGSTDGSDGLLASDGLVRDHLPLVGHVVREALSRVPAHVQRDDLASAGMLALVQASRSFDAARGVPFVAFAGRRIRGAILDELRDMDWASRSVRRRDRELDEVRNRLSVVLRHAPSADELAAATGLTRLQLADHIRDVARASLTSLHAIAGDTLDGLPGPRPVEPDVVLLHRERLAYLRDAVSTLPERLRCVVEGYFFDEVPMAALALTLGVTESRISQLRAEALVLLRHVLHTVLDVDATAVPTAIARVPAAPTSTRGPVAPVGVVHRRRAEYVARVSVLRTVRERLAYVHDTELSLPA